MKYILTLLAGIILGSALVYFLLVGAAAPGGFSKPPGVPVRPPDAGGAPPGTAVLKLDEQFFNTIFATIFRDMNAPTFKLAAGERGPGVDEAMGVQFIRAQAGSGGNCQSQVVALPEGSGVSTGMRFADNRMLAPLAFSGTYNMLGNCWSFRGWAQANIQLSFGQNEQTLYGQINVEGVNLEGVPPIASGVVTQFVQNAINQRVNPLVLMRGSQLALSVPVQATGGTLRALAKDIRAEIRDNALYLHVTYDFSGADGGVPVPPPSTPPQSP